MQATGIVGDRPRPTAAHAYESLGDSERCCHTIIKAAVNSIIHVTILGREQMARIGDFSKRTIHQLAEAADHCCARCYQKTSYFDVRLNKRIGFGRAAHIVAASSGGPRSDPLYTVEQLKAADNGVHLCANCADLVDKDPDRCPVEYLQDMQRAAEARTLASVMQPGFSGAVLTSDQAQRLSQFIRQASDSVAQLSLFKGNIGWEGSWIWREYQKARGFIAECSWISQLNHALCAGTPAAIDMQSQVVESIRALCSQVDQAPWFYDNDYPKYWLSASSVYGPYREQVNAAGERAQQYLDDIFRLICNLRGLINGGSGISNNRY